VLSKEDGRVGWAVPGTGIAAAPGPLAGQCLGVLIHHCGPSSQSNGGRREKKRRKKREDEEEEETNKTCTPCGFRENALNSSLFQTTALGKITAALLSQESLPATRHFNRLGL
jgi:hypothetical protein